MKDITVTESILYVGCDDKDIDLFESQYPVPDGVTYNSYVILDEKTAVMDTVDNRATGQWLDQGKEALGERKADYLIISQKGSSLQIHMQRPFLPSDSFSIWIWREEPFW